MGFRRWSRSVVDGNFAGSLTGDDNLIEAALIEAGLAAGTPRDYQSERGGG